MKKRKCIFCREGNLTNEHIYPKWLFEILQLDSLSFQPSTTAFLVKSTENSDRIEHAQWSSDERNILYKDFKTKAVCQRCNNGWMSELENEVKPIVEELLNESSDVIENYKKAFVLSRWAIVKIILIVYSARVKQEFDPFILQLLKSGIIPEGFMVEMDSFEHHFLNFHFGNTNPLTPHRIPMEEMLLADENFFVGGLQIGIIGLRISLLKTSLPVQRKQINKRIPLLYPFNAKLPYIGVDFPEERYPKERDDKISALCNSMILSDTP